MANYWTVPVLQNETLPVSGAVSISGTVPVSTVSLPLPAGAAQDATLTSGSAKTQVTSLPSLPSGSNTIGKVDQGAAGASAWPVSASALPLPTGAAQDATLTGGTAKAQLYDGTNVIGVSAHPVRTDPTGSTTQPVSGSVSVTNFPVTQAVSGTFWQSTQPISAAALPLPTNAAQETGGHLANIDTQTARIPAKGSATSANSTPVVIASDQAAVPVSAAALPLPSGAATDASITNGNLRGAVSVSNFPATQPVSAASLPLPTGAAQEAGGNLASILAQLTSILANQTSGAQTICLPSGASRDDTEQSIKNILFAQLIRTTEQVRLQAALAGQALFLPELPGFLGV